MISWPGSAFTSIGAGAETMATGATKTLRRARADEATIRIRITYGEDIAIGQGKADLLQGILETGSISGGARKLGMSYRKAWLLVDEMNRCFLEPVVVAMKGGPQGGGTRLTPIGREALDRYRVIQKHAMAAIEAELKEFRRLFLLRKK
jgi:molybdate transport system regulatory protein